MKKLVFTNSLGFKFMRVSFITCLILYIITIVGSGVFYSNALEYRYRNLCKSVSEVVAGTISADSVDLWLQEQNNHEYVQTTNKLKELAGNISNVDSIAIYQMREDGMYTVYNTKSNGIKSDLGSVVSYDNKWAARLDDFLAGNAVDDLVVNGYAGQTLTYCTPVFKSDGECAAYVCVGISKAAMHSETAAFVKNFSAILFFIIGVLFVLMSIYIKVTIVNPIKRIGEVMKNSAQKGSLEYMTELSALNEGEGEIESILKSSVKVFSDKVQITSDMRREQKNVMLAFTTLMETVGFEEEPGRKNHMSGYARIIAERLAEKPEYADVITPEMCDSIALAAPLNDVGKITIPDEILYKPGKLTEEEFELVKTHAENGAKIIEETMRDLPEAEYLELAKEIAWAHHERWDGKGYPRGLKGEDIPLSARIVAVADVFDTLVTKRSYREAVSINEAYKIMLGEKGHFDPLVMECFVEAKDAITDEYNDSSDKKSVGKGSGFAVSER